jgi:hypothetical protein
MCGRHWVHGGVLIETLEELLSNSAALLIMSMLETSILGELGNQPVSISR